MMEKPSALVWRRVLRVIGSNIEGTRASSVETSAVSRFLFQGNQPSKAVVKARQSAEQSGRQSKTTDLLKLRLDSVNSQLRQLTTSGLWLNSGLCVQACQTLTPPFDTIRVREVEST